MKSEAEIKEYIKQLEERADRKTIMAQEAPSEEARQFNRDEAYRCDSMVMALKWVLADKAWERVLDGNQREVIVVSRQDALVQTNKHWRVRSRKA